MVAERLMWNFVAGAALLLGCASQPAIGTPIASGQHDVRSIVATPAGIYWVDNASPLSGRIMRAHDGSVDVIADGQMCPASITADQVDVFWLRCDGAIVSIPLPTGPTSLLLGTGRGFGPRFVLANDSFYSTTPGGGGPTPGQIITVANQPGAAVVTLVTNLTAPDALAVDSTNVYWLDDKDKAVYERTIAGDPTTPPTRIATLAGTATQLGAIATDGVHLYWSDFPSPTVHAMRISDGQQFELASAEPALAFAFDATDVYWISSGEIERAPLAGGDAEEIAVVQGPARYGNAFALTDHAVIFADDPEGCDPTIMDCYATTLESAPK